MSGPPPPGRAQLTRAHARRQFENWSRSYDRSWLNEFIFFPGIRACHEEIARWQAARGGGSYRLLDVGCGTGNLLLSIARDPQAALLIGLDYSAGMLARLAGKPGVGADGRMQLIQADAEHLPLADACLDVITCCNSFHHYPHQDAVVREFRRVLRPGGRLILLDGFRDNVIGWLIFDLFVAAAERHVHHCSWSRVRELLGAAGFAEIRQRKLNVLTPVLVTTAGV